MSNNDLTRQRILSLGLHGGRGMIYYSGFVVAIALSSLLTATASAATVAYTEKSAYDAATAAFTATQLENFDGIAENTQYLSGSGPAPLTFTYSIPGYLLTVGSGFETTSGSNFLGLNNASLTFGDKAFNLGDSFTVHFGRTVNAVGLYLVAGDDAMPGDLELSTSTGSVLNSGNPVVITPGNNAFFLGLVDPVHGFTSASVRGVVPQDAPGAFLAFTADDITSAVATVPEPGSWVLMLAGLGIAAASGVHRKR
jgi:hypothetical protein